MADEPGMLERIVLWVRRNAALMYVLLGSALVAMACLAWYAYGPVAVAHTLGVMHHRTVKLDGGEVTLPRGWREHNSVSRSDLHLERPSPWHVGLDTVDVDDVSAHDADFERMLHTLTSLEKMSESEGDTAMEYPLTGIAAERFVCMAHANAGQETLHVTCLMRDGRRVVKMAGKNGTRQDFAAILASIAALPAGNPK